MKIERKKVLLVSLILDDLVHTRLVHGLLVMGLPAEYYAHDVPFTVMELMGFNEEQQHQIFPRYRTWQEEAHSIDISHGNSRMRRLAERIYERLEKMKSSTSNAHKPPTPASSKEWLQAELAWFHKKTRHNSG